MLDLLGFIFNYSLQLFFFVLLLVDLFLELKDLLVLFENFVVEQPTLLLECLMHLLELLILDLPIIHLAVCIFLKLGHVGQLVFIVSLHRVVFLLLSIDLGLEIVDFLSVVLVLG